MGRSSIVLSVLFVFNIAVNGQEIITGRIVDLLSRHGVGEAELTINNLYDGVYILKADLASGIYTLDFFPVMISIAHKSRKFTPRLYRQLMLETGLGFMQTI